MLKRHITALVVLVAALCVASAGQATRSEQSFKLLDRNVHRAAIFAWCGHKYISCPNGEKAYKVSLCETGNTLDRWAANGQYLGLWQMGSHERETCGQVWGRNPWYQAQAAYCWFTAGGGQHWERWACA